MLPGYKNITEIYIGKKHAIYRGQRKSDSRKVVIKTPANEFPSASEIDSLRHEHEILSALDIDGVIKTYGLEEHQNRPFLILEDFSGGSVKSLFDSNALNLDACLRLAIKLSDILANLYKYDVVHRDINPNNILFVPETGEVKLIDFGISSRLSESNEGRPDLPEGTMAYISPEQTGRVNSPVDHRTDFYSLGVTFYQILTGELPFQSTDSLELIHMHLAQTPTEPIKLKPKLPKPLSQIIMILLAKSADERYQSARGLKADLETCLRMLQAKGKVAAFELRLSDRTESFEVPQKLYGRDQEIKLLMSAFDRVSQGAAEMMLVSGFSGIGKSALVNEVRQPIARQNGHFIFGKFDQFRRDIPYSSLIQAFQELVSQILMLSEGEISAWKRKITDALGVNGQVIVSVIPEVEIIIGPQPKVQDLPPTESQNRFNLVFERFIQVFTQKAHPLVIFLDDLQWADNASLKLLQTLVMRQDSAYLFIVGAFRDNEVDETHPLILTLREIGKTAANVSHLSLSPLDLRNLNQFVADALKCKPKVAKPLTNLILKKTNGCAFWVKT